MSGVRLNHLEPILTDFETFNLNYTNNIRITILFYNMNTDEKTSKMKITLIMRTRPIMKTTPKNANDTKNEDQF